MTTLVSNVTNEVPKPITPMIAPPVFGTKIINSDIPPMYTETV